RGLDDVRLDGGVALAKSLVGDADAAHRSIVRRGRSSVTIGGPYDRRMVDLELPPIRLTELTECGGCAAKLGADALSEALAGLGFDAAAESRRSDGSSGLIAGLDPPDDAAVHLVAPGVAV